MKKNHIDRRDLCFVYFFGLVLFAVLASGVGEEIRSKEISMSGDENPELKSFDDAVIAFMKKRRVPGGALAVMKDGRLVYARGYGWADVDAKESAHPTSLFRIASISKPITGVAIMKLVEDHRYRLKLDAKAFKLLDLEPYLENSAKMDKRLKEITVRQLLQHTGGFDREKSGDPMFMSEEIAKTLGKPSPAEPEDIIRYMMGKPLDFDPGTREAYSNFGYCVLGRVIEKVTGKCYEDYMREEVLAPIGITQMRMGRTLLDGRAKNEVRYYQPKLKSEQSVFAKLGDEKVPNPYGAWHLEAMDAHGGWIASAVDLARFAAALDRPGKNEILSPQRAKIMYERPRPPAGLDKNGKPRVAYYGLGWNVRPTKDGKANYWHAGSLPGTATLLVRRHDGLTWVVLFNQRSRSDGDIDSALHKAADKVKKWPDGDLFARYK